MAPNIEEKLKAGFTAQVSGHPRLYFTAEELSRLKERLASTSELSKAKETLIKSAEKYLNETEFSIGYYGDKVVTFPLPPKQPEPIPDPPGFTAGRYPYWTRMSRQIQQRMETLAMGFALSEDARFGKKAIQYGLALSEWNEWTDTTYPSGGNTCLDTAHFTLGAAAVYDMTYGLMSEEERVSLRTAMLEKGMRYLYEDIAKKGDHNLHMLRTSALGGAAMVLLGEIPEANAYIGRAYENFFWYLDQRMNSGQTEGLMYTSYAMDYVARFADVLVRVTGDEDFLNHPWVSKVLPEWVTYFLAPGGREYVNFSDSSLPAGYYLTMSLLAHQRQNGLAGWYLEQIPKGGGWHQLINAGKPVPVESPEELQLPPSKAFMDIGWVAFRSGWGSEDHLLAFQSSGSKLGHNQLDQHNLVLNVGGAWLLTDPGYPDYSPGPKRDVTKGTIGHNSLLVNGEGQERLGTGELLEFFHSPALDYTTGEAGSGYQSQGVESWQRQIAYIRPNYFLVVDRVKAKKPVHLDLLFHTDNEGELLVGGDPLRIGQSTTKPSFRITKGIRAVEGFVLQPERVTLTYTNVAGAEEFGPFVKVAPSEKIAEATIVTMLRPINTEATPDFSVTTERTDGAVLITTEADADTEYVAINERRATESTLAARGDQLRFSGELAMVRRNNGKATALSLANGTELFEAGQTLFSSDKAVSVGLSLQTDGAHGRISASEATNVTIFVGALSTVALNGAELPAEDYAFDVETGLLSLQVTAGTQTITIS